MEYVMKYNFDEAVERRGTGCLKYDFAKERGGLMKSIAHMTHLHDEIHTVTGVIAILLMLIHAMWAIWTYTRGSLTAKAHFNRFSIFVWCIWLIPYFIGMYLGMSHH